MKRKVLGLCFAALCLVGCGKSPERGDLFGGPDAGSASGATSGEVGGSASGDVANGGSPSPATGCEKMDILFVIDNSASMTEEQANLAASFPKFIQVLDRARNGELDYRVGVTTTAFPTELLGIQLMTGEQGTLLKSQSMTNRWLARGETNLSAQFSAIATVGTGGSGQEQPLKAARAAVTERMQDGTNSGFVRDDALLAVVILTDEDDQSADDSQGGFPLPGNSTPVSEFVMALDAVKGARSAWATAVIAGAVAPQCTSAFGSASYAARLDQFVSEAGDNAVFSSICDGDLSKALEDALNTFTFACDNYIVL